MRIGPFPIKKKRIFLFSRIYKIFDFYIYKKCPAIKYLYFSCSIFIFIKKNLIMMIISLTRNENLKSIQNKKQWTLIYILPDYKLYSHVLKEICNHYYIF